MRRISSVCTTFIRIDRYIRFVELNVELAIVGLPPARPQITVLISRPPSLLNPYLTADLEVGRASAAESLDSENLVIEVVCLTEISTVLDIKLAWSFRSRTEKP
jgi:hypothetical protein